MSRRREKRNLELDMRGMTCDACAAHVTEALEGAEGVFHVEIPGWFSGEAVSLFVQAEGLKLAAQTFDKNVSQRSCCAG